MKRHFDDLLQYEEDFHGCDRKLSRMERKKAIKQDRSGNKKTDLDQLKKKKLTLEPLSDTARKGRILAIHPDEAIVDFEKTLFRCQLKGALKKEKQTMKNLVTIGDFVFFEPREENTGLIVRIEPRKTVLSRADNLLQRKEQLIASNIDQVLITTSISFPSFKPSLLDRYIIAARKGGMTPIIVVNKIDLLEDSAETELLEEAEEAYKELSIPFFKVSTLTGEGIDELKKQMENKTSVFSGQSGTGKSSLINATLGKNLKTGEVVERTLKGAHTTTAAQLIPLEEGGFCIDTPGIKSFGVWALKKEEVESYFEEIAEAAALCRFQGCAHDSEPDCGVKQALEEGKISSLRFASYLSLLYTLSEKHRTR
jgi:ribosome biogenesis GTPase / thiamine phosphate phosphatase